MGTFFLVAAIVAMLAVLASLAVGLVGMARGGEFNARYGNTLMRWRVILQGIAIALIALAIWTNN
ncbi:MAG: hypothetical protein M1823_006329 [Watsoniomyces obsoletus]|nr:MAG: hypothetical protein M1823_006329 [Watsoniomyces obsoletus]